MKTMIVTCFVVLFGCNESHLEIELENVLEINTDENNNQLSVNPEEKAKKSNFNSLKGENKHISNEDIAETDTGMDSGVQNGQLSHTVDSTRQVMLDSIFDFICAQDIKHENIVFKQVIWETGWLKSEMLMQKKNLFGFKVKRYLQFDSWQQSVIYYKKWQSKYFTDDTEDYYDFLVRIRYADSGYSRNLKKLKIERYCN